MNSNGNLFIQRGPKCVGPFPWSRVVSLHQQHKLQKGDLLREGTDGPWEEIDIALKRHLTSVTPQQGIQQASNKAAVIAQPQNAGQPGTAEATTGSSSPVGRGRLVLACGTALLVTSVVIGWIMLRNRSEGDSTDTTAVTQAAKQPSGGDPRGQLSEVGPLQDPLKTELPNEKRPPETSQPVGKVPPADMQPAARVNRIPPAFIDLAQALSNPWTKEGEKGSVEKPSVAHDFDSLIARMESARHPTVLAAVEKLKQGKAAADAAVKAGEEAIAAAHNNMLSVFGEAAAGGYLREVDRATVVRKSDGTTSIGTTKETVDESGFPLIGAALLSGLVQGNATAKAKALVKLELEYARMQAWGVLIEGMKSLYPESDSLGDVIRFRVRSPKAADGDPAKFVAINGSGRTLTNVTLFMEFVHFTTMPEPSIWEFFFIPEWKSNEEIRLPVTLSRNLRTIEYSEGRPPQTDPLLTDTWLGGLGGVVGMKCTAWASEGHQSAVATAYPERAEIGGEWEMTTLARFLRSVVNRSKFTPEEIMPNHFRGWGQRAARRVLENVPASSTAAHRARMALESPQKFYEESQKLEEVAAHALLAPGTIFQGKWEFHIEGFGIGIPSKTQAAIRSHKGDRGELVLQVDGVNLETGTVAITLFDPAKPDRRKQLQGVLKDPAADRKKSFENLVDTKAGTRGRVLILSGLRAVRGGGEVHPEDLDFFTAPGDIELSLNNLQMSGRHPGYLAPQCYWFNVSLVSIGKANDPAAGQPSPAELPKSLAGIIPGAKQRGQWQLRASDDVRKYVPMLDRRMLAKLSDQRGILLIRFEDIHPETREFTAILSSPDKNATPKRQRAYSVVYYRHEPRHCEAARSFERALYFRAMVSKNRTTRFAWRSRGSC